MTIFRQQTTFVEPLSLDEAYLDVTDAVRNRTYWTADLEDSRP